MPILALSTPVTLIAVAAVVQYADQTFVSKRMQAIVDAAAITEVKTFELTGDATQAVNAAWAYLGANSGPGNFVASDFKVSTPLLRNRAISAQIDYFSNRFSGPFTRITGAQFMTINVRASAEVPDGESSSDGDDIYTYAGAGGLFGELQPEAIDGSPQTSACSAVGSNWYEGLSDSGLQVNFNCARDPYWNATKLTGFTITIGGHVVELKNDGASPASAAEGKTDSGSTAAEAPSRRWRGALSIDGVRYEPPPGWSGYLDNQINALIADPKSSQDSSDWITILYRTGPTTYRISATFGVGGEGQVYIKATNAGACGAPGGVWGQRLLGLGDPAAIDFRAPSPAYLDAPYYRSTCTQQAADSDVPDLTR